MKVRYGVSAFILAGSNPAKRPHSDPYTLTTGYYSTCPTCLTGMSVRELI